MLLFNICIKHPDNSSDYNLTWGLLKNTLRSICNQTIDNFRVVVVCNKILDKFEDDPTIRNVDFVEVDWPPVCRVKGNPRTGIWAARYDKSRKYCIGLIKAKEYMPDYVMIMDGDDFIHKDLTKEVLEIGDKNGYYINKGYILIEDKVSTSYSFFNFCGTCHIFKYDLLMSMLGNLGDLTTKALPIEIQEYDTVIRTYNEQALHRSRFDTASGLSRDCGFLDFILGSHRWGSRYFLEMGHKLHLLNTCRAIYNLNHNDHHSDNNNPTFVNRWFRDPVPITQDIIDDFNLSDDIWKFKFDRGEHDYNEYKNI